MDIEWDEAKNAANLAKHGLSFAEFSGFDAAPRVLEDDRFDYGETRWIAFGHVRGDRRVLVFTIRPDAIRIISYRAAHKDEVPDRE